MKVLLEGGALAFVVTLSVSPLFSVALLIVRFAIAPLRYVTLTGML
jgi:hypothetical protein